MVGGLTSQASGGEFNQGAMTALMVHLFNDAGDVFRLKLKVGAQATVSGKFFGIGETENSLEIGSGNFELILGKDSFRTEKHASQGAKTSIKNPMLDASLMSTIILFFMKIKRD